MNFGEALDTLREGQCVKRMGWNGQHQWLQLQVPDEHSKMTEPYIYMVIAEPLGAGEDGHGRPTPWFYDLTNFAQRVPWVASQTDLLAEDWEIVYFGLAKELDQ